MPKTSAGLLVYRYQQEQYQVLLVHPGGPFFVKKDNGAWSVPKGEYEAHEDALEVAKREFKEETGNTVSRNRFTELPPVKSKSGKILKVWAVEDDFDSCFINSNLFELEWPPRSGKIQTFPEVDKAGWFSFEEAKKKISFYQLPLLEELERLLPR